MVGAKASEAPERDQVYHHGLGERKCPQAADWAKAEEVKGRIEYLVSSLPSLYYLRN